MSEKHTLIKCLLMFTIVLGLWQISYAISNAYTSTEARDLISTAIQIFTVAIFIVAIKLNGSDFGEYGFKWFDDSKKQMAISALLAIVYISITFYVPGFMVGFVSSDPISLFQLPIEIAKALLAGFATELAFRGYAQGKLTKTYGLIPALYISSFLFSIHRLSLLSLPNLDIVVTGTIRFFILGIFLGFFFNRTKSLAGALTFHTAIYLAYSIIPTAAIPHPYLMLVFEVIANICVILLLISTVPKRNEF